MKRTSHQHKKIRTQVILTQKIIAAIDRTRKSRGESRSEYLRRAALLRLSRKEERQSRLQKIADEVIGSTSMKKHPVWNTSGRIERWRKDVRNEWQ